MPIEVSLLLCLLTFLIGGYLGKVANSMKFNELNRQAEVFEYVHTALMFACFELAPMKTPEAAEQLAARFLQEAKQLNETV